MNTALILRPPKRRDLPFLFRLRNSPEVVAVSRSQRRTRPGWFVNTRKWLKVIESNGQRIGYVMSVPIWEVSIALIPEARGKGYGTQALNCLDHSKLVARIQTTNQASLRAFQKAGFQKDETYRVLFRET